MAEIFFCQQDRGQPVSLVPVYSSVRDPQASGFRGSRWARISRNVLLLGLTSLFTDISSEMLTAVLPLYFMLELKMTPLQFGLIDGLYQGASALIRVASGLVADAGRKYKTVAVAGYALSSICKAGLLVVSSSILAITGLLMLDRIGKGIRTAPRDALITLSSEPEVLGEAFGAHRALDTVGAVVGPLLAFAVLAIAPAAYDAVFVVSLAFGVIGVALIGLFVQGHEEMTARAPMTIGGRLGSPFRQKRFGPLVIAGALLGVLTATDALIYLLLQRGGHVPPTIFPLLFVGTSAVYLVAALPVGRLADWIGRHRVFILGHVPILALYAILAIHVQVSVTGIVASIVLLGLYYAATDGVLPALASQLLPSEQISTGLAIVTTASAVARLCAAALFGALWSWRGPTTAVGVFLVGLFVATVVASAMLQLRESWPLHQEKA